MSNKEKVELLRSAGFYFASVLEGKEDYSLWDLLPKASESYYLNVGNRLKYSMPDIDCDIKAKCECGSEKANTPGHSTWCSKFEG